MARKKKKPKIPAEDRPYYHPITGYPLPLVMRPRRFRNDPPCPKKPLYAAWEAGVYLGISRQAVTERCRRGTLAGIKKGRLWKIPYDVLRKAKEKDKNYDVHKSGNLPWLRRNPQDLWDERNRDEET